MEPPLARHRRPWLAVVAAAQPRSNPVRSSDRHALPSASWNVPPIAITSPTDFIVDVSTGSASGNFSKANRGTFTTT